MITGQHKRVILTNMIESLELPETAYKKAKERYEDIGEWLGRADSACAENEPHIFPQGSFRLGTAIRPLDDKEEYDLDLTCRLQTGITKQSHSQKELKDLVGDEIETYRIARNIKAPLEEKHRCWRLEYADNLSFHMDIVPCIPEDDSRRKSIRESMIIAGESDLIAESVSQLTVSITDDRHPKYKQINDDWNISNPEGYAKWFESRMNQGQYAMLEKAQIDAIPVYQRKTPLQRTIQILKRHRDRMFKNDSDVKPISIIITTLAARVYQGEGDIESALRNILSQMGNYVNRVNPRIPNPVNPAEDFADRWAMPECQHLNLERNFWSWLEQAQSDFELLLSRDDLGFITEQAQNKYSVNMNVDELSDQLGLAVASISVAAPKAHAITDPPAKPWDAENK